MKSLSAVRHTGIALRALLWSTKLQFTLLVNTRSYCSTSHPKPLHELLYRHANHTDPLLITQLPLECGSKVAGAPGSLLSVITSLTGWQAYWAQPLLAVGEVSAVSRGLGARCPQATVPGWAATPTTRYHHSGRLKREVKVPDAQAAFRLSHRAGSVW